MGRTLILAGIALVAIGLILLYAPWLLSWFGRLPGDIRIETERSRIFFPVTSMILVSILVSVLMHLFRR